MRTPPEDLTEEQVAAAVSRHWSITAATIGYAPLGFGSHHRLLSDDPLAAGIGTNQDVWVITHGEPKANNTMMTAEGPVLVDWDTVALAAPARDVWMTGLVGAYTELTGRTVHNEELEYYRLRWDLKDLCAYADWFAGPHRRTADTDLAWKGSIQICRRLAMRDVW
jgi:spectinomycin phosphotransferase